VGERPPIPEQSEQRDDTESRDGNPHGDATKGDEETGSPEREGSEQRGRQAHAQGETGKQATGSNASEGRDSGDASSSTSESDDDDHAHRRNPSPGTIDDHAHLRNPSPGPVDAIDHEKENHHAIARRCQEPEYKHIREETLSNHLAWLGVPTHQLRRVQPARQNGVAEWPESTTPNHDDRGVPLSKAMLHQMARRHERSMRRLEKQLRRTDGQATPLPQHERDVPNTYAYETQFAHHQLAAAAPPKKWTAGMLKTANGDHQEVLVHTRDLQRIEKGAMLSLHHQSVSHLLRDELKAAADHTPPGDAQDRLLLIWRAMAQNGGNAAVASTGLHAHINYMRTAACIDTKSQQKATPAQAYAIMSRQPPGASHLA